MNCDFCGKSKDDGARIACGPAIYICDSCVEACCGILGHEMPWRSTDASPLDAWRALEPYQREVSISLLMDRHKHYRETQVKWRSKGLSALVDDADSLINAVGVAIDLLNSLSEEK